MTEQILVPIEVVVNKCLSCGVSFAVIGIGDANVWLKQIPSYCPYCGKLYHCLKAKDRVCEVCGAKLIKVRDFIKQSGHSYYLECPVCKEKQDQYIEWNVWMNNKEKRRENDNWK